MQWEKQHDPLNVDMQMQMVISPSRTFHVHYNLSHFKFIFVFYSSLLCFSSNTYEDQWIINAGTIDCSMFSVVCEYQYDNMFITLCALLAACGWQVRCGKCNNGLGHEFLGDGPEEGMSRFWIFSESLKFVPAKGELPAMARHKTRFQILSGANSVYIVAHKDT